MITTQLKDRIDDKCFTRKRSRSHSILLPIKHTQRLWNPQALIYRFLVGKQVLIVVKIITREKSWSAPFLGKDRQKRRNDYTLSTALNWIYPTTLKSLYTYLSIHHGRIWIIIVVVSVTGKKRWKRCKTTFFFEFKPSDWFYKLAWRVKVTGIGRSFPPRSTTEARCARQ